MSKTRIGRSLEWMMIEAVQRDKCAAGLFIGELFDRGERCDVVISAMDQ